MYSKRSDYKFVKLPDDLSITGNVMPVAIKEGRVPTLRREDFAYLLEAFLERHVGAQFASRLDDSHYYYRFEDFAPKFATSQSAFISGLYEYIAKYEGFERSMEDSALACLDFPRESPLRTGMVLAPVTPADNYLGYNYSGIAEAFWGPPINWRDIDSQILEGKVFDREKLLAIYRKLQQVRVSSAEALCEGMKVGDGNLTMDGYREEMDSSGNWVNKGAWTSYSGMGASMTGMTIIAYGYSGFSKQRPHFIGTLKVRFPASVKRCWMLVSLLPNIITQGASYEHRLVEMTGSGDGQFSNSSLFTRSVFLSMESRLPSLGNHTTRIAFFVANEWGFQIPD